MILEVIYSHNLTVLLQTEHICFQRQDFPLLSSPAPQTTRQAGDIVESTNHSFQANPHLVTI